MQLTRSYIQSAKVICTSIIVSTAMTYIIIAGFFYFKNDSFELNQFDIYEKKQCILPQLSAK
jgi:hypothetical protein